MSDLIRREDALKAIDPGYGDFHAGNYNAIRALPAVQPDTAAIRETALREAEKALRDWQNNLILCGYKEAPITVGMAADLIATLKGVPT